jgi:two-component system sensor histidine kinase KdpD
MLGAATTLRDYFASMTEEDRIDLLSTVVDESERLNRFIANLLDMTRIESGAMEPNYALHYVGDIVGSALRRAAKILAHHKRACDDPSRSADGARRSRAVRAGAVQPARQCREICAGGIDHRDQGWSGNGTCHGAGHRTEGPAFRPAISTGSSTPSTGCARAIRSGPAPGSACRSAAASSRRWAARSRPETAPTGPGAVFTIRLPVPNDVAPEWKT